VTDTAFKRVLQSTDLRNRPTAGDGPGPARDAHRIGVDEDDVRIEEYTGY
jgi:hypothetical protein